MTDYLEVAKDITREHAANSLALRRLIMDSLRECAKGGVQVWAVGHILTDRILDKFTVEEK